MTRRISKIAADIIMKAVDEYLDCERFDVCTINGESIEGKREEYKRWLSIRGALLGLWLKEDNKGRHYSLGRV